MGLSSFFSNFNLADFLITVCAVILALSVHELCHGLVAYKLGDPTAKNAGRLTLNPLAHLDPLGLVCMVLFRFGWAKPVPIDMRYFRHPRRDMAIVAAAGPVSNLIFGTLCVFCYYLLVLYAPATAFLSAMATFFATLTVLNVGFAVFNLLPVPPLDGSRVVGLFLPQKWYWKIMQYERYIQVVVMLLLYLGVLTRPLAYARQFVMNGIESFVRWILL
ncbi:MAG: site-2 protease family protein [Clostridiaceae bacterium]|nr:site-2 protease family protein [Clostridiaceae bacterium]